MKKQRVILGITSAISFKLIEGWPEFLSDNEWEVHLVSSPGDALNDLPKSVTVHSLPMAREPSFGADIVSFVAWFRLLRKLRPDMVMLGTPKASLLGMTASALLRVPSRIYLLRGLRGETATGWKRKLLFSLEKLTSHCAHSVLAVSQSLATKYITDGLSPASKVTVVGLGSSNGVDLKRFSPDKRERIGSEESPPVIGFVGRLTPDKGLSVLMEAEAILLEKGISHRIMIVGGQDGPRGVENSWPAGANVVETGLVTDTAPFYKGMSMLVLPTFREGFPNVVLEASASGVPVVTTNATGAVDSVIDGVTGIVIPSGDAEALAESIEVLLGDATLRYTLGVAGRTFVEQNYDREKVWSLTESYMRDQIAHTNRGSKS